VLQRIYVEKNGLEHEFSSPFNALGNVAHAITSFKMNFFAYDHLKRTEKHISNPLKGSSAKRLNMFLRWMVRPADKGVDLGIWKHIPTSSLMLPLDVHTGNVSRKLGLLKRKQNDWKSVNEVTAVLKTFDPDDPIKYDFALFGLGISGQ